MPLGFEDSRKKKIAEANESFNQMLAECRAVTKDRDEQLRLLTQRVLDDLIRSKSKKLPPRYISFGPIPKKKRGNPCEKYQVIKKRIVSPQTYRHDIAVASSSARNVHLKTRKDEDECDKYYYEDEMVRQAKKMKASPETSCSAFVSARNSHLKSRKDEDEYYKKYHYEDEKVRKVKKMKPKPEMSCYTEQLATSDRNSYLKSMKLSAFGTNRPRRTDEYQYYKDLCEGEDSKLIKKQKTKPSPEMCYYNEKIDASDRNFHLKSKKLSTFVMSRRSRTYEYQYYKDLCEGEDKKLIEKKSNNDQQAKKKKMPPFSIPNPEPDMPLEFKNKIESLRGYQVQLVMYKRIYHTDLTKHHDRLTMPVNQVLNNNNFAVLDMMRSIKVKVIDTCLEEHEIGMTKWNSRSSFSYVLTSGWYEVPKDKLEEKDVIQIWSFRIKDPNVANQERLCLALIKLDYQEKKEDHIDNGSAGIAMEHEQVDVVKLKDDGQKEDSNHGSNDSQLKALGSSSMSNTKNDDEGQDKEDCNGSRVDGRKQY